MLKLYQRLTMGENIQSGNVRRSGSCFRLLQVLLVWLLIVTQVHSKKIDRCPDRCYCHLYYSPEDGPSIRVECKRGGMRALPVDKLDRNIRQLFINPQPNNPNFLTIGPILTQPVPYSNLRDLTISNSNIPAIGHQSFWGLVNLRTLNLTGNNITSITAENFRGLVNLNVLYLDHNQIEQMASETFSYMTSLKRLSLTHNHIILLVPRLFRSIPLLESLNLSHNPIGDLNPEVFKDIQGLLVLKCRKCYLSRVNVQIYHLAPLIEELDLGQNLFKYLTDDDFSHLKKLKKLHFDGNQVSVIVNNVFKGNGLLQYLDISHNRIALLAPGSLTNLTSLTHLDISYNRLDKFNLQSFAPVVKSLTSLDLSGNNLQLNEVAVLLQILPGLFDIGLANLSLKEIPPNFFMYTVNLKSLDISSNLLTRFPLKLLTNTRFLQRLVISNNKIRSLDEKDLRRLEAIAQVSLAPNPWQCDQCTIRSMFEYMRTTVLNETIRGLRCYYPVKLRGTYFSDLTNDVLEPCAVTYGAQIMNIVAGMLIVVMSVVVTAVIALYCTRRRGAQYYTNEEKRRERDPEHPEELLVSTNNSSVSTIQSQQTPISS